MTRTIEDYELKDRGLICIPHITKHLIGTNDCYCIIVFDRAWDALTHEDDDIKLFADKSQNANQMFNMVNTSISYGSGIILVVL